jgi:hypothetical protein
LISEEKNDLAWALPLMPLELSSISSPEHLKIQTKKGWTAEE